LRRVAPASDTILKEGLREGAHLRDFNRILRAIAQTVLTLFAFAGTGPATAASLVDQSQAIATSEGTSYAFCSDYQGIYNSAGFGSSFTAGASGLLTSVELPVVDAASSGPGYGATMNVWIADGITGIPTGQPIASQEILPANLNSLQGGGNLIVVFDTPTPVVATAEYAFTIDFPIVCPDAYEQMTVAYGVSNSGKRAFFSGSGNAGIDPSYGISFTTYVDSQPAQTRPTELSSTGIDSVNFGQLIGGSALSLALGAGVVFATRRRT